MMAKCRIGHFAEAQILQALEIDYIDESEVLTPADLAHHVDKWGFTVPFVCGATNLGEALRRIAEGAAMIRTKGEAGTGDVVNAVTHMRAVFGASAGSARCASEELYAEAKELRAPLELVQWVAANGQAAGGHLHRRRDRDPGRRRALHAARRRRRLRRLGHLQVGRSRRSARARSSRRRRTTWTPTCSRASPRASARRWSGSRPRRSTRASCSRRAAGRRPAHLARSRRARGGRVKKFSLPAVAIEAEALISRQSAAAATIWAKR